MLTGDDLRVHLVCVPAHRIELVPAKDARRGDLGAVLVEPRFARAALLCRWRRFLLADCTAVVVRRRLVPLPVRVGQQRDGHTASGRSTTEARSIADGQGLRSSTAWTENKMGLSG